MKCSTCDKEAVNGMIVCGTGPCLFPGKVRRFLTSDAACGLGPDAAIQAEPIFYAIGLGGFATIGIVALLVLL